MDLGSASFGRLLVPDASSAVLVLPQFTHALTFRAFDCPLSASLFISHRSARKEHQNWVLSQRSPRANFAIPLGLWNREKGDSSLQKQQIFETPGHRTGVSRESWSRRREKRKGLQFVFVSQSLSL